jgi:hypothetical protein
MTHDAGRSAEGQRYLLLGLRAASEAGDAGLAAHLLSCLSRLANHLGRVDDALEMVQLAQYGTRKLPPGRVKAILAALEARYLAITGDISGFQRAAGAAADGLEAASPDSDPEWAQWFDAAEYHATIGVAHMLAAAHQPALIATAITMTSQAIPLRPAERARSRAFDHIGLARAHVIAGDLDATEHAAATDPDREHRRGAPATEEDGRRPSRPSARPSRRARNPDVRRLHPPRLAGSRRRNSPCLHHLLEPGSRCVGAEAHYRAVPAGDQPVRRGHQGERRAAPERPRRAQRSRAPDRSLEVYV